MIPLIIMAAASLASGIASSEAQRGQATQSRIAAVRRRLRASDDARMIEEQGGRFASSQAAGFAKSGVLFDSGSPLATLMDTAVRVERNAMKTRLAGDWDSGALDSSASAYDMMATGSMLQGVYGAAGSFLSGANTQQGSYVPSTGGR